MSGVISKLQPASYRGISFLVPSESKKSGIKSAVKDYPGTNRKRFVEQLGAAAPEFSITAVVHGLDAIERRIRLEQALEQQGTGILVHPSLGRITCVALDYTSSSDDTSVGEFKFDITFSRTEPNISLSDIGATIRKVSRLAGISFDSIDNSLIRIYRDTRFNDVLRAAKSSYNQITAAVKTAIELRAVYNESVNTASGFIGLAQGFVSETSNLFAGGIGGVDALNIGRLGDLFDTVRRIDNTSGTAVRIGSGYASSSRTLYRSALATADNPAQLIAAWQSLCYYNSGRVKKPLTTAKRIDLEANLGVIEDHCRINALISFFEAAAYANYRTENDLLFVRDNLNERYSALIENAEEGTLGRDPDVRSALSLIRTNTLQVMDEKLQNVWRIVDINPSQTSLALVTYQYYGSIDNIDVIKNLNQNVSVSIITEPIKGVSD